MEELPGEMLLEVLSWVGAADLVCAHRVCTRWHALLGDRASLGKLWRRAYFTAWPPALWTTDAAPSYSTIEVDWREVTLKRLALVRHCTSPPLLPSVLSFGWLVADVTLAQLTRKRGWLTLQLRSSEGQR
jgi:hypothetical protein